MKALSVIPLATALLTACQSPPGAANMAAAENAAQPGPAENAVQAASAHGVQSDPDASHGRELPEGSANLDFIVVNRTGRTITAIAIAPEGEDAEWSENALVQRELPEGERAAVSYTRDIELCVWAIRARFEDGVTRNFPAANLCDTVRVELR